jgi:amino acid adenylation domain-containing protein
VSEAARQETLIHRAVARYAAARPAVTALACRGQAIGYRLLDAAADSYAAGLADRGVGPGCVVPVLGPRSARLVVAQLAVLKCGAAYACVDERWPAARVTNILRQVAPVLVVADGPQHAAGFAVHRLPAADLTAVAARGGRVAEPAIRDTMPATVFFTSGTTGGAKGIVCPHRAVTRMFQPGGLAGFGPGHATPQAAPVPWDMYAFELWGQLTSGGTCVLVEEDHLLPGTLRDLVRSHGVDTLWLTTSLFNLFMDEDPECFRGLCRVLTGGEKLSPGHVRRFLGQHPGIALRNGYGPAENCMLTTTRLVRPEDCDMPNGIPVGTPVPGTEVLVIDAGGQPCQPGQPGEVCIAGTGLAVGYLARPELTREKFPVLDLGGEPRRVYRSGDAGVLDHDGVLHYLGRQDQQIKMTGYRIELAEIEQAARRLTGVRDCVVLPVTASDGSVARLALFYLAESDDRKPASLGNDPLQVREGLTRLLPAYLVPATVRITQRFPVTANGKLDRAELLRLARRLSPGTGRRPRPAGHAGRGPGRG